MRTCPTWNGGTPSPFPPCARPSSRGNRRGGCSRDRSSARQLRFNHIRWKLLLVQQRPRHAAESASGLFLAAVAEPPSGSTDLVIRHRPIARLQQLKKVSPSPGPRFEFSENRERLAREGYDVRLAHLHSSCRYVEEHPPLYTLWARLHAAGVWPSRLRKRLQRCAWSVNPQSIAISLSVASVFIMKTAAA